METKVFYWHSVLKGYTGAVLHKSNSGLLFIFSEFWPIMRGVQLSHGKLEFFVKVVYIFKNPIFNSQKLFLSIFLSLQLAFGEIL